MARPRTKTKPVVEMVEEVPATQTNKTQTSAQSAQTKGDKKMSSIEELAELSFSDINDLLSGTRARGEYGEYLKEFIASGKVGIQVDFDDPLMVGKNAEQAKIGFENAKKATIKDTDPPVLKVPGAGAVKIVKKNAGTKEAEDWKLFLINTALVAQQG